MAAPATVDAKVAVLCGGVGAARFLNGLVEVVDPEQITAIGNVGDDLNLHGLHISPDIDTIIYTLADQVSQTRGWGLKGESWQAMETLKRYGGQAWFGLGDRDLGTHLYRTQRLNEGATLTQVTGEIAAAWDIQLDLVPASNDEVRTVLHTIDYGDLSFQEYFVGHSHGVSIDAVSFDGAETATAAPSALAALSDADVIVIAPSNPAISIDPILAIPAIEATMVRRREVVCAVSPIVGGEAIKGPAARLMNELGGVASAAGVARWYQRLCSTLVFDVIDEAESKAVTRLDVKPVPFDTIMSDTSKAAALSQATLASILEPTG